MSRTPKALAASDAPVRKGSDRTVPIDPSTIRPSAEMEKLAVERSDKAARAAFDAEQESLKEAHSAQAERASAFKDASKDDEKKAAKIAATKRTLNNPSDYYLTYSFNGVEYVLAPGESAVEPMVLGHTHDGLAQAAALQLGGAGVTYTQVTEERKGAAGDDSSKDDGFEPSEDEIDALIAGPKLAPTAYDQPFRIPNDQEHYTKEQLVEMQREWARVELKRAHAKGLDVANGAPRRLDAKKRR